MSDYKKSLYKSYSNKSYVTKPGICSVAKETPKARNMYSSHESSSSSRDSGQPNRQTTQTISCRGISQRHQHYLASYTAVPDNRSDVLLVPLLTVLKIVTGHEPKATIHFGFPPAIVLMTCDSEDFSLAEGEFFWNCGLVHVHGASCKLLVMLSKWGVLGQTYNSAELGGHLL